jgi:hypothetical protein
MGYITITTDVDLNYDDVDDNDLLDILEDRLKQYRRRQQQEDYKELVESIQDLIELSLPLSNIVHNDDEGTLAYELKLKVCKELMNKYSLEQLEELLIGK